MGRLHALKRGAGGIALLMIGLATGGAGVYVWVHEYRYRDLADADWQKHAAAQHYTGSKSCRDCHQRFYELWAPSHHGKAMQPVTAALAEQELQPLDTPIQAGTYSYTVDLEALTMIEQGDKTSRSYPMLHALGGKNIFFFLTPLERGRLQVLPLSYDVRRKEWFKTTGAMVRHFVDVEDEEIDWHDPLLTFNTACYNCHVSQINKNYDIETDSYHTTWTEPGITCEACHGPGDEHARVCEAVPAGTQPKNMRIISWDDFDHQQTTDACAPCHAKMRQMAPAFQPGDRFFDNYDLVGLENPDFYVDGRDLGENYTMTGWTMNPCVQGGDLDCIHCHTSSGRYRFKDKNPNGACLPCHAKKVAHPEVHTHHTTPNAKLRCIDCHMPMTEFGRMLRSDHSFRPPVPEASAAFDSPLACLICHKDKDTDWAASHTKAWHPQQRWRNKIMHEGTLVEQARRGEWGQLEAMLDYMQQEDADPVVIVSLCRMFADCRDSRKWPILRTLTTHTFEFIRAAAVTALTDDVNTPLSRDAIKTALSDDYRVIRISAAWALASVPRSQFTAPELAALEAADADLLTSFKIEDDRWNSHYNLGNYLNDRGQLEAALASYIHANELRPDMVPSYVNGAIIASRLGRMEQAIELLRKAHAADPMHAAVNQNLGMALAEQNDMAGAEKHFRLALKVPQARAAAAYNLAVMVADRDPDEAIELAAIAATAEPQNPRHGFTYGFYLHRAGRSSEAAQVLREHIAAHPAHAQSWFLLADCYRKLGHVDAAQELFKTMAQAPQLPADVRRQAKQQLR